MERVTYYAQLVEPYVDKYNSIIPTTKKIKVIDYPNEYIRDHYAFFGKDASYEGIRVKKADYPENFTQLDYVKKYHEIIIQYGHGGAEFESVPCKLFKKVTISKETIIEI